MQALCTSPETSSSSLDSDMSLRRSARGGTFRARLTSPCPLGRFSSFCLSRVRAASARSSALGSLALAGAVHPRRYHGLAVEHQTLTNYRQRGSKWSALRHPGGRRYVSAVQLSGTAALLLPCCAYWCEPASLRISCMLRAHLSYMFLVPSPLKGARFLRIVRKPSCWPFSLCSTSSSDLDPASTTGHTWAVRRRQHTQGAAALCARHLMFMLAARLCGFLNPVQV